MLTVRDRGSGWAHRDIFEPYFATKRTARKADPASRPSPSGGELLYDDWRGGLWRISFVNFEKSPRSRDASRRWLVHMKSYDELSAIVKSIEPVLRENAAEAEAKCDLPKAAVDTVRKSGLLKLWVPESLGGWQVDPVTSFRIFEDVSAIDSAAGWLVQMSASISGLGLFLGDRAVEEMYKGGNNIFADAFSR
jgi:hypothetical protein